jgi:hypothetical protein
VVKSRRIRPAGRMTHIRAMENAYKILIRISEGKRSLGRRRHGWENRIKMDLK